MSNSIFDLIKEAEEFDNPEIVAKLIEYGCIIISSDFDRKIKELIIDYCNRNSNNNIKSYVDKAIKKSYNFNIERLVDLFSKFDGSWKGEIRKIDLKVKEQVNSLIRNRNSLAHGGTLVIGKEKLEDYNKSVNEVIRKIKKILN